MNTPSNPASPAAALPRVELRSQDQVASVQVPAGWSEQALPAGLRLQPADHARLRNPPVLTLTLGSGVAPAGDWPQQRELGRAVARYRLASSAGGSGGDEVELTAWVGCGAGHLLLRYSAQAEAPAAPDLSIAWAVLGSAVCRSGA